MPPAPGTAARLRLIRYLARGGAVVREDIGGVIGVWCCDAGRTGRSFDAAALDRLVEAGCVHKGHAREIRQEGQTYKFAPLLVGANG